MQSDEADELDSEYIQNEHRIVSWSGSLASHAQENLHFYSLIFLIINSMKFVNYIAIHQNNTNIIAA